MNTDRTNIPFHPMRARLKTTYKTKLLWASFDGESDLEIYRDLEESIWIGTYHLQTGIMDYYWQKCSVKPKVSTYTMTIPELDLKINEFNVIPVEWSN